MIAPPAIFADGPAEFEQAPTGNYIPTVPYVPDDGSANSNQTAPTDIIPPPNKVMEAWQNRSPLSLSSDYSFEDFPDLEALTDEEARSVLKQLRDYLKEYIISELGEGFFENLTDETVIPDHMLPFVEAYMKIDHYLRPSDHGSHDKPDTPLQMLQQVSELLGPSLLALNRPSDSITDPVSPMGGTIQQLSNFIAISVQTARERIQSDSLLNARKFLLTESVQGEMERPDPVMGGRAQSEIQYKVVDSEVLTPENAKTYAALNSPNRMQPFLRQMFYGSYLKKERVDRYLKARAKVEKLFRLAKEGKGLIRYKGQIVEAFLPPPGEGSGAYELVQIA